jgi:hypothetical protein
VSVQLEHLPQIYLALRERWQERNERMDLMRSAVAGDWDETGPDDDELEVRSPNLVQVALEDTAEAASMLPSVRVGPAGTSDEDLDKASAMEQFAQSYMDGSQAGLLTIRTLMDLVGNGIMSWAVVFDPETKTPRIEWRDPATCYPEPGWQTMDAIKQCVFARELYMTQLPVPYQAKLERFFADNDLVPSVYRDHKILLIEHYGTDEILIAGMYSEGNLHPTTGGSASWTPIEFERIKTTGGICPVVVKHRLTFDNEPRGQFDQVLNVMKAHIQLMAMVLDYADQAVYSDIWVKDLIGQMAFGGGSYIQLGPQGDIGRVPPAVSSLSVFQELEMIVDHIHVGGRWPSSRPGEIDQSIASAKFLESSAGMMNTVIRTLHMILQQAWEQALRVAFVLDKELGSSRTVAGVLRNQQFRAERDPKMIDLAAPVRVEYGMGLGRDIAQSIVLAIQAQQAGFVSTEFVQENFEGIQDVERERRRLDESVFRDIALQRLMEGLQGGSIPPTALAEIARARRNGTDIIELFDKYVAKPQAKEQANAITSGIDGMQLQPGPAPMGGPQPPAAPPPEELLGSLLGGGTPPESNSRLSIPLGGGSFVGTQT